MSWIPFDEWKHWGRDELRSYAEELGEFHQLTGEETDRLFFKMGLQSVARRSWPKRQGPLIIEQRTKELLIEIKTVENGGNALADDVIQQLVWEECRRLNVPYPEVGSEAIIPDLKVVSVGRGLTRKSYIVREEKSFRRFLADAKYRKSPSSLPRDALRHRRRDVERDMREILWSKDYITFDDVTWFCPKGYNDPFEGLFWYYQEVCERLAKAERKLKHKMFAESASLAFEAGELFSEMKLKAAHDEFFSKAQATRQSQSDGGAKRKKLHDPELAKETWWKYRNQGYKKADAGRAAGRELGLSERTIRRSFEGESYPE